MAKLSGTIAAALTPLRDEGAALDEEAVGPYVEFLVSAGLDGLLAFGSNGEAVLLSEAERRRGLELFVAAAGGRVLVAAHCGAQTTSETVALAAHAAEAGADAVAAIGPPYFKLDPEAQRRHLAAAAQACAPLPFYVYEFAAAAGYPFDLEMLQRLRDQAPNFVGLKVSDAPWEAFSIYLLEGLDIFVGPESLIHRGREAGAVGAVSALASAFPDEVSAVVRDPSVEGAARLSALRMSLERFPRHAATKRAVAWKGVPMRPDVRPPLRDLDDDEVAELEAWLTGELGGRAASRG
jgi:dihydrodipicolinate synthase/N-acetylneuraminate lyase